MRSQELDVLIGGYLRKPSKRTFVEAPEVHGVSTVRGSTANDSYMSQMSRKITERTQKLTVVEDTLKNIEESSTKWLNEVSEFAKSQQKKAALSALTGGIF